MKENNRGSAINIAIRSGDGLDAASAVCIRAGDSSDCTETQVSFLKPGLRAHRKNKDRRGTRWMRGRLLLDFGTISESTEHQPSAGEIKSDHQEAHPLARRRIHNEHQLRNYTPLRGIPFNYYYGLNKLFSKLSIPKHRPFEDVKIRAMPIRDGGNYIPLSVVGVSTALVDSGYSQKDFIVAAKVIINNEDLFVEPTLEQELLVDLTRINTGQGVLMLEYFALSNRIVHVYSKGQLSSSQLRKALALAVASCQNIAASATSLISKKYDETLTVGSSIPSPDKSKASSQATKSSSELASLKSSFKSMLTNAAGNSAHNEVMSEATSHSKTMEQSKVSSSKSGGGEASQPKITTSGKKLSLADLAKAKKKT